MGRNDKKRCTALCLAAAVLIVSFLMFGTIPATAQELDKEQQLVDKAKLTFDKYMAEPPSDWFKRNQKKIKAVLIFPQVLQGALIIGGAGGSGVMLVRNEKTGEWSYPAFYTSATGSIGLQIGGKASELVFFVTGTKGQESFYATSFKLGGDTGVALGPVGGSTKGATSTTLSADIAGFERSKGLYAGLSVEGAFFKVRYKSNNAYYGKETRPTDIFIKGSVENPGAVPLREAVAKAISP